MNVVSTAIVGIQAAGVTEGVGYSDPVGLQQPGSNDDEDEEAGMMLPGAVPPHYTLQLAQA